MHLRIGRVAIPRAIRGEGALGRITWATLPWILLVVIALKYSASSGGADLRAYFDADPASPYRISDVRSYGVLYSPAFVQLIVALQGLPWPELHVGWLLLELGALAWMVGPWLAVALAAGGMTLVGAELINANTSLLLGVVIWAGFRYPALWSFALLTKVTPGVGLIWFAVRREWRPLAVALGATVAIAVVSFVLAPGWWADWFGVLTGNVDVARGTDFAPLWARELSAVAIVGYGAHRSWHWMVPLGAALAHPDAPMIIWVVMLGAVRFYVLNTEAR
jgi:hypothetical protein